MSIRPAQPDDAAAISRLIASLAHSYCEKGTKDLPAWFAKTISEQAVRERIQASDYLHYVYVDADRVVGYIAIKRPSHLYHLFVRAAQQGRGIARRLWQQAIEAGTATSYTVRSSLVAVPVYERFGFRASGPAGCKDGIQFQPMECHL